MKQSDSEQESGFKTVSSDSIINIRQGGSSYSFNFNSRQDNNKSYLPDRTTGQNRANGGSGFVPENTYHYGSSPNATLTRQVAVIEPITRQDIKHNREAANPTAEMPEPYKVPLGGRNDDVTVTAKPAAVIEASSSSEDESSVSEKEAAVVTPKASLEKVSSNLDKISSKCEIISQQSDKPAKNLLKGGSCLNLHLFWSTGRRGFPQKRICKANF